jgi:ubiquinone/menaquinone biosynthesis C-methylase UbiE
MDLTNNLTTHFERVSRIYGNVRDTDLSVSRLVASQIKNHEKIISICDMGCGTGRYTVPLAKQLERNFILYCCDCSASMLKECKNNFNKSFSLASNVHYIMLDVNNLPFGENLLDAIVTFNAVHLFDLFRFVNLSSKSLKPGGLLIIYTRTPEQNKKNIWGRYFPKFTNKETRLYSYYELVDVIYSNPEC